MKGRIVNYRRGKNTEYTNQYVIELDEVKTRDDAYKWLGKKVVWRTPSGKTITGKITRVHGNKGAVVARFNKGLPGQAIGTEVEIK